MALERYLVCPNRICRFILDMYLDGDSRLHRQIAFPVCPQCGSYWHTPPPISAHKLDFRFLTAAQNPEEDAPGSETKD